MEWDRKLFQSLFVVQILASFLVLAGHYTADVYSYIQGTPWEMDLNQISRYGTVLLAMITGFFTAHSFAVKKVSMTTFFSGKIKYIFIPFLLAGILYNWILLGHLPLSMKEVAFILLGKTGQHLYFVFMLCQFYLFAFVFRKIITRRNMGWVLVIFLVIQYTFIKLNPSLMGLGVRHFLPTWIFTLYLGYAFYEYRESIIHVIERNKFAPLILGLIGLGSVFYFIADPQIYTANHIRFVLSTFVLLLITAYILYQFIDKVSIRFQKGLTFYVYLSHPVFILYFNKFFIELLKFDWLMHIKWVSFFYCIVIWVATLALASLITTFMAKLSNIGGLVKKSFS